MNTKRIAVLTSGGGAPGMNVAIRALKRKGLYHNLEVIGIANGYEGLIQGDFLPIEARTVAGIIKEGGSILKLGGRERLDTLAGLTKAVANIKEKRIDIVVALGGNETLANAKKLSAAGIMTIVIPATINNDMPTTDYTIGFDTALNTILQAINKIRDTVSSHDRVAIVEIIDGCFGQLTFMAGLASGAEAVLVPDKTVDMEGLCQGLIKSSQRGKLYSIILVSQGVADCYAVADQIEKRTSFTSRVTVLGHTPRGGAPSAMDSINASCMGASAIDYILQGKANAMVVMNRHGLKVVPFGGKGN
ncbi:MAG: 6-phosphofructokinase [Firmicutes bacterium]|nr:6-phosphofructokinase [Bacillota bacterium]